MFNGKGANWDGVGGLLGLFGIGSKLVDSTKGSIYDTEKKMVAKEIGNKTYIDRHGIERNVRNNHKTWHVTDADGYDITIDSKTKEILKDTHKKQFEKENNEAREKAIKGGYKAYRCAIKTKTKYGAPVTQFIYRRTSDDKTVELYNGNYVVPFFKLNAVDNDDNAIKENRETLYKYCRKWYIDMKGPHPIEIKDVAKQYDILIFESDVDYCLNQIDKANGGKIDLETRVSDDETYAKANWVDAKYWI